MSTNIETSTMPSYDVALMGSCGIDNIWRSPLKQACADRSLTYFDPYSENGWSLASVSHEVHAVHNSKVVFVGVNAKTDGYGSLCEIGWSAASAVLDDRQLHFLIERPPLGTKPNDTFLRTRKLAIDLMEMFHVYDPELFTISHNYNEFIERGIGVIGSLKRANRSINRASSKVGEKVQLEWIPEIAVFGVVKASNNFSGELSTNVVARQLADRNLPVYQPPTKNWSEETHHSQEMPHKLRAKVLVQTIDSTSPSFGSLVETGIFAATALSFSRPFGVLIKDYYDPDLGSVDIDAYPNRVRQLTRGHLKVIAAKSNGLIFVASNEKELAEFAVRQYGSS
ncbi:MAG: hypothetical protein V4702_01920 [Patescibacteria group bacterium]